MPETATPEVYVLDTNTGQSDYRALTGPTTVEQLFKERHPGADPGGYTLAVNNNEVKADHLLNADDTVAFTPNKVEGAE